MITIKPIASSSRGNAHYITDGVTPLLLDGGVSMQTIRQKLDFKTSDIAGALITHSHKDHAGGTKEIMKAGIDIFLSKPTTEILGLSGHRINIIEPKKQFEIGTWQVMPFDLVHDVPNLGFLLQNQTGEKLVYITDTAYCKYKFRGLTHIMIETNFAKDILEANIAKGAIPFEMKRRLIQTHFSLDNVKEFLKANDLFNVREIILVHLSDGNSDEARFKREIQELTGKPVYVAQS